MQSSKRTLGRESDRKVNYGKINACMEQPRITLVGKPPQAIKTLLAGFNLVASHVYLIVLPVLIDLGLWLGPKLRLKELLSPIVADLVTQMLKVAPADLVETVKATQTMWAEVLEQFNVATAIRTLPVGIPSLMARLSPMQSPLPWNPIIELPSVNWAVASLGIFLTVGFLLGSLFFYQISRQTAAEPGKFDFKAYLMAYVNTVALFCLLLGLAILISIPMLIILSILSAFNSGIAQFIILLMGFMIIWLVIPLVFSVHGIFVNRQKPVQAAVLSVKLVRFFLPGTGLFIMTAALISELLNRLWLLPEPDSWLLLLGVFGHAFVVTSLIVASFIYYREGLRWMHDNIGILANRRKNVQPDGGTTIEQ